MLEQAVDNPIHMAELQVQSLRNFSLQGKGISRLPKRDEPKVDGYKAPNEE
jgi:hypothetical protein